MSQSKDFNSILKQIELFASLTDDQLAKVGKLAELRDTPKGQFLLLEKQKTRDVFLILSGKVQVEIALPGGKQLETIATLRGGDVLGELALLGISRRSASARVVEDVQSISLNGDGLLQLFSEDQGLGYAFMKNLAGILAKRIVTTTKELGNAYYHIIYHCTDESSPTLSPNEG